MSEPFIGQIMIVGFNFAPRGWALCNGQILSIAQNTALFSLLGTTYGGNGQTTFALPNLQSRVPVHFGQGTGLSNYDLGQVGGVENATLSVNNMPAHAHQVAAPASSSDGNDSQPTNNLPAIPVVNVNGTDYQVNAYISGKASDVNMATGGTTTVAGGSQPFSILPPYLALNFVIAMEGIFPSRN